MKRHRVDEWMDDPALPVEEHNLALVGLARLNFISRAAIHLWKQLALFQKKGNTPLRILELASGNGDMASDWMDWARLSGLSFTWTLSDYNPRTVEFLTRRFRDRVPKVEARLIDAKNSTAYGEFDLVVCNLFLHHFDPDEVLTILRKMADAARVGILVGDLSRGWLDWILVWLGCHLLSRSRVVRHDGPASVRAAYTALEIRELAEKAGLAGARVESQFPCRWILRWERPNP